MGSGEERKFDELLELPKSLGISDFDHYINEYIKRKADKGLAIQELDRILAILQNHITSLSLYLKQNHLLHKPKFFIESSQDELYTKQEVAIKYRVSVRTVTNWIIDGLETIELGGVKRISKTALQAFASLKKTKKFNWKSIAR